MITRVLLVLALVMGFAYAEESEPFGLTNPDNWKLSADLNLELRYFPIDDDRSHTEDYRADVSSHLKVEFENDYMFFKFGGLVRQGVTDDGRNILLLEDAYADKEGESYKVSAGYKIHTWKNLEGFRVSDILNSRNLDGDYDIEEKYGELTLSFDFYATESSTLSFFYFPEYQDPYWMSSKSRMGPVTGNEVIDQANVGASVWVEGNNTIGDSWGHQAAVKFSTMFDESNIELDIYGVHHMDRTQPFITIGRDLRIRPHHFRVTQYGLNATKVIETWMLKLEAAYRDFENASFQPLVGGPTLKPIDHGLAAVGIEKSLDLFEGHSTTGFLEYQKIIAVDFKFSEQYTPFQNDIFVGLRTDFNDVDSKSFTFGGFLDLDKRVEYAISAEYSQRIKEQWKILMGGRMVQSPNTSALSGLALFRDSDHVYLKLSHFY